jgi:hypothetical protein
MSHPNHSHLHPHPNPLRWRLKRRTHLRLQRLFGILTLQWLIPLLTVVARQLKRPIHRWRSLRQGRLRQVIHRSLQSACTAQDGRTFELGAILKLTHLYRDRYWVQVALHSRRSGGVTERVVEVRLRRRGLGRLEVKLITPLPLSAAPLAPSRSVMAGCATLQELGVLPDELGIDRGVGRWVFSLGYSSTRCVRRLSPGTSSI